MMRSPGRVAGKAVLEGRAQMVIRVMPAAGVQGIGIGQKGLSAELPDQGRDDGRVGGTEIRHIPGLAEMDLEGRVFIVQVEIPESRLPQKAVEFFQD